MIKTCFSNKEAALVASLFNQFSTYFLSITFPLYYLIIPPEQ